LQGTREGDVGNVTDRLISEHESPMIIEMEKPFAVLDAAIERCFPGYYADIGCEGAIVHYVREELTSGSVRYLITAREPGDLGSIDVYQTGSETCKVLIGGPERPQGRQPAHEDMAAIRGIHDKRQYKRELQRLLRAIRAEDDEIYEKRRCVHDRVVSGTLKRVERDLHLSHVNSGSPPPGIKGKLGRRRLEEANPTDFLYRIAKAQEAEEWRAQDPAMGWSEIAKEIGWKYGYSENGLAQLRRARRRLEDLKVKDPDGWLLTVQERRRGGGATETMET